MRESPDNVKVLPDLIQVHPHDSVAVALRDLAEGELAYLPDATLRVLQAIPKGHKVALIDLPRGAVVQKYGNPIGVLSAPCAAGDWIHSHNLETALETDQPFRYQPQGAAPATTSNKTFLGYRRANGKVGTRNELWMLNTVGCVNQTAERIAAICRERFAGVIDGAFAFAHPYGCSQLGDDLENTRRVLAGLMRHPNAGGVLVIGLGCENNQLQRLIDDAGVDPERLRFFNAQEVADEVDAGVAAASELIELMAQDSRETCALSDLVIGLKCGGSDGFSGITANAIVGRVTEQLCAAGGTAILTEVPEMFGAEHLLMNRASDTATFEKAVHLIERFKEYFRSHGQPIYENPSPGNKAGGLTTLEEKSLGAVQKGGHATVTQVLNYGEPVAGSGLALLESPGNDAVSATAEVASGATLVLFTTGRGTPLGFPVPTLKIASNSNLAERKPNWIDFDAGRLLDGMAAQTLADELLDLVIEVASGRQRARNEQNGIREIAIWKRGVTL